MDESDQNTRVTRKSARRLTSESLNESESRADTPTKTPTTLPRAASKLESISESDMALGNTPKGRALGLLDSTRRSRKPSEEPAAASPFRRVTRATSNEREITSSPMPTRTRRRSATADSDTDDAQTSNSETAVKSARKKRQSVLPIIEQIKEEPEEDIETPTQSTVINDDELELRSRSISKSPSVHSPSKSSLNGSSNDVSNGREERAPLDDSKIVQSGSDKRKTEEFNTSVTKSASKDKPEAKKSAVKSPAAASPVPVPGSVEKRKPIRSIFDSPSVSSPSKALLNTSSKKTEDEFALLDESEKEEEPKKIFKSRNKSSGTATPTSADNLMNISCVDLTPIQAFTSKKRYAKVFARDNLESTSNGSQSTSNGNHELSILVSEDMQVDEADSRDMNMDIIKLDKSTFEIAQVTLANNDKRKSKGSTTIPSSIDLTPNERASIDKRKSKDFNTSIKESANVDIGQANESSPSTASPTKHESLVGYIKKVEGIRDFRKSQSHDDTNSPKEERVQFWNQVVTHTAAEAIDTIATIDQAQRYQIVEDIPERVLREKSIPSDESEDEEDQGERNDFIDDEAEEGSGESITESERNYLIEHEIPDNGESLGSQDTYEASHDEDEDEEEVDEENDESNADQFIDDEEISNTYSMDEQEEEIEIESPLKQKRRSSRIIIPSSSEDEFESATEGKRTSTDNLQTLETSVVVAESPAPVQNGKSPEQVSKKTPTKSPVSSKKVQSPALLDRVLEEPTAPEESFIKASVEKAKKVSKRKRESVGMEEVSAVKSKTKRSRIDPAAEDDESEAVNQQNVSGIAELADNTSESEPEVREKPTKVKNKSVDLTKIIETCSDYVATHNEEKRARLALKRERKAQKLAKKKEEEAAQKETPENFDSSNGSNKENDAKKKKKKAKKQKPVEELPEKETMARSVNKEQEKMELKRQRKKEKKLAKQQQQAEDEENTPVAEEATEELEKTKKNKKSKKSKIDEVPVVVESEVAPKKKSKKSKAVELEEAPIEPEVDLEVSAGKKKKKKNLMEVSVVEAKATLKKKPQRHDDSTAVDEPEPQEKTKKTKKRKLEEVLEQEEPQKKKKLKILTQIENSSQFGAPHRETHQLGLKEETFSMSLSSQKLKAVIPPQLENVKKQKKKSGARRHIPEPRKSLPRPVWSAAGTFLEESVSPYKFSTMEYTPINAGESSTKFGLVNFEATKKKKPAVMPPPAHDYKTKAIFRNMKHRDGSQKNIQGLLKQRNN